MFDSKSAGQNPNAKRPETVLDDLGPLYHSFELFGVSNQQLPGIFESNQKAKAPIIRAYIQMAIAKSRASVAAPVTFAELFCADGYYTMAARLFGASRSCGIDNGREGYFQFAPIIASRLGLDGVEFHHSDVNDIDRLGPVDIVANVGNLYHVSNPREILEKSYRMAARYLIVRTVVSMANDDENYLEVPAPGWTWGCRFSRSSS